VWLAIGLTLYLAALLLWRDAVPDGLNNDAAEEALRGLHLLEARQLQVFSSSLGVPQETLYLYVVAALAKLLGPTALAIQVVSWAVGLSCVAMLVRLSRRVDEGLPAWVTLLLALSSLWLFHYARSGLRAISAPFFCLAVALLLDRAERAPARRPAALACGATLALSLYTYTACRVLVLAFVAHAALRLWRTAGDRRPLWRCYAWIAAAALVGSIPNLYLLATAPGDVLWRGWYVVPAAAALPRGLWWSALVPVAYDASYRQLAGPTHIFDGVSAAFATAGLRPLHPLVAGLLLIGAAPAWRRRARPALCFLFFVWLLGTLGLGIAGPSLTRLLIVLPSFLVVAGLGAGALLRRWPRSAPAIAAALLLLGAGELRNYFTAFAQSRAAQAYFSPAATPIGRRAGALGAQGLRVVAVVSKDANVVVYLAHEHAAAVRVVEFYGRPLEPREVPVAAFQPQVLLVERSPGFAAYAGTFPAERHVGAAAAYDEIRLD
jgi:hypothetical protein